MNIYVQHVDGRIFAIRSPRAKVNKLQYITILRATDSLRRRAKLGIIPTYQILKNNKLELLKAELLRLINQ